MRMTQPLLFVFLVIFIKETISSVGPALEDINSENQEQEEPLDISEILHSQGNISSIPEVDCECMHGNCTEVEEGYPCNCDEGWEGQLCDQDVNECDLKLNETGSYVRQHQCTKGRCVNKEGGYDCDCPDGYEGTYCETKLDCNHVECLNGGICSNRQTARPPFFDCQCQPGFEGVTCEIQNSATPPPPAMSPPEIGSNTSDDVSGNLTAEVDCGCLHGSCREDDIKGGYQCSCNEGWEGQLCDQDEDECRGKHKAGSYVRRHQCRRGRCVNKEGGYDCDCESGYEGAYCENRSDCNHVKCLNGGTCTSRHTVQPPFFRCRCQPGFRGTKCERKIPCHDRPCRNGGTCKNKWNDFHCSCPEGWTGKTCTERDPCFGQPCLNGGSCQKNGEDFNCTCSPGWTGDTCTEEQDVCKGMSCSGNGQCKQKTEGFQIVPRCRCNLGYAGSLCQDEVCQGVTCSGNGECRPVEEGNRSVPRCKCNHGYEGSSCEDNIVDRLRDAVAEQQKTIGQLRTEVEEKQKKMDQLMDNLKTFASAYEC